MARLMAVADAFSAMTTDRPYRKGMGEVRALAVLEDGAVSQWVPNGVEAVPQSDVTPPEYEDRRLKYEDRRLNWGRIGGKSDCGTNSRLPSCPL